MVMVELVTGYEQLSNEQQLLLFCILHHQTDKSRQCAGSGTRAALAALPESRPAALAHFNMLDVSTRIRVENRAEVISQHFRAMLESLHEEMAHGGAGYQGPEAGQEGAGVHGVSVPKELFYQMIKLQIFF